MEILGLALGLVCFGGLTICLKSLERV